MKRAARAILDERARGKREGISRRWSIYLRLSLALSLSRSLSSPSTALRFRARVCSLFLFSLALSLLSLSLSLSLLSLYCSSLSRSHSHELQQETTTPTEIRCHVVAITYKLQCTFEFCTFCFYKFGVNEQHTIKVCGFQSVEVL